MSTLKCTIVLDKEKGISMTVEDEAAGTSRTAELLGDSIVLTVKGQGKTSVLKQTAEEIALECTKFTLKADEIECTSTGASTYTAKTTMGLKGTQKVSVEGQQAQVSGTSVDVKAQGTLNAEASGVATLKGSVANVSASQVVLG